MNRRLQTTKPVPTGLAMLALVLTAFLGGAAKPQTLPADKRVETTRTEIATELHDAARRIIDEVTAEIRAELSDSLKPDVRRPAAKPAEQLAAADAQA